MTLISACFTLCLGLIAFSPGTSAFRSNSRVKSNSLSSLRSRNALSFSVGATPTPVSGSTDSSKDSSALMLKSPCKLNLFLRILGKRPNGFHELASLFQAISLSDTMYFTKLPAGSSQDEMTCSDSTLSVGGSNLVVKALNLMREKTGINQYFSVHLEKTVPMQAGLGGGSGNAATAMYAFNKLTGFTGTSDQLKEWSGDIGSDITFFFSSGTAYCTGRGEIVESLPPLPVSKDVQVHVFKPDQGLSTASVFSELDLKGGLSSRTPEELLQSFVGEGALVAANTGCLVNDLEIPAFVCSKALQSLKHDIAAHGTIFPNVMMSGSGTSIYALSPLLQNKDDDNDSDSDSDNNVQKAVDAILDKHPGLKYFKCHFVSKEDTVGCWYDYDYDSI